MYGMQYVNDIVAVESTRSETELAEVFRQNYERPFLLLRSGFGPLILMDLHSNMRVAPHSRLGDLCNRLGKYIAIRKLRNHCLFWYILSGTM